MVGTVEHMREKKMQRVLVGKYETTWKIQTHSGG